MNGKLLACAGVIAGVLMVAEAQAQSNPGQFGSQARADSASQMIVLGVQQGISSLPPTSGQSLSYEFDPELSTFVASENLGPTAFRSPQTIGDGKWSVRAAATYFKLKDSFGPIKYLLEFDEQLGPNPAPGVKGPAGVAELGLDVKATVSMVNIGTSYGITDRLEFMFNIPVTVVEANASQVSSTRVSAAGLPPSQAVLTGPAQPGPLSDDPTERAAQIDALSEEFDNRIGRNGPCTLGDNACLTLRNDDLPDLGVDFNEGARPGVGRISLGLKYLIWNNERGAVAVSGEFFNPSPSEGEFAGSESPAILPRLIGSLSLHEYLRLYSDVGYDYDFDSSELRRFTWDFGIAVPIKRVAIDFGVGGSEFDTPISWTPKTIQNPRSGSFPPTTLTALGDNELGDSFIDFLGGIKVRIAERAVISGSVNVPLNNQGFRPDAAGTLAVEGYF